MRNNPIQILDLDSSAQRLGSIGTSESIFSPSRARALPVGKSACSELTGEFPPVLPPGVGIAKVAEELPSTFPRPTPREGTGNQVP